MITISRTTTPIKGKKTPVQHILIWSVRIYQKTLSPYLGGQCRFHPTCSDYAILTIGKDGALKGTVKSIWRILKCNPFNEGGIDYP